MENEYIYIDESGDTGYTKKSTRYFILTAVIVDDPYILRRIAKNVHKSNLNKKKDGFLHAYKESDIVKNKLVKRLKTIDIECIVFVLDKNKEYTKDPYMYLLEKIINSKYLFDFKNTKIIIARKETNSFYNKKIANMFKNYNFIFSTPNIEKSLQIADFYSWCVFSYLECSYDKYFSKLENQIIFR